MSDVHRFKIHGAKRLGAAKGLAHMVGSTPKTFHRDIKSAKPRTVKTCVGYTTVGGWVWIWGRPTSCLMRMARPKWRTLVSFQVRCFLRILELELWQRSATMVQCKVLQRLSRTMVRRHHHSLAVLDSCIYLMWYLLFPGLMWNLDGFLASSEPGQAGSEWNRRNTRVRPCCQSNRAEFAWLFHVMLTEAFVGAQLLKCGKGLFVLG